MGAGVRAVGALATLALVVGGCYDFHQEGPEDPTPINPPRLVSITIEYVQPPGCLNRPPNCGEPVVFFASWTPPTASFRLLPDPGGLVWRGRVTGVPVNFPPRQDPYTVRIFDPHLVGLPTGGVTANRITIGGEKLTHFTETGTEKESALVYIDENGIGHNPF
jgi:hypothetical protein